MWMDSAEWLYLFFSWEENEKNSFKNHNFLSPQFKRQEESREYNGHNFVPPRNDKLFFESLLLRLCQKSHFLFFNVKFFDKSCTNARRRRRLKMEIIISKNDFLLAYKYSVNLPPLIPLIGQDCSVASYMLDSKLWSLIYVGILWWFIVQHWSLLHTFARTSYLVLTYNESNNYLLL